MKRPKNAAPNTAFTVISRDDGFGRHAIARISLDPSVLDCEPMGRGKSSLQAPIVWDLVEPMDNDGLYPSCRSFFKSRDLRRTNAGPIELGAYLESNID